MVPYVRKSFYKHWKNGLKWCEKVSGGWPQEFIENEGVANISIEDNVYMEHKKAYDYAYEMTRKEIYQAVEGMYHNLNTLQSRSGN